MKNKSTIIKCAVVFFLVFVMVATTVLPAFAKVKSPTKGTIKKTYTKKNVKDSKNKNRYDINKNGTAQLKLYRTPNKKTAVVPQRMTYKGVGYRVTKIKAKSFRKAKKVKHLKIRKNITQINKNAFRGSNIQKITFYGRKAPKLKKGAFSHSKIKEIVLPVMNNSQKKAFRKALRKAGYKKKIRVRVFHLPKC